MVLEVGGEVPGVASAESVAVSEAQVLSRFFCCSSPIETSSATSRAVLTKVFAKFSKTILVFLLKRFHFERGGLSYVS